MPIRVPLIAVGLLFASTAFAEDWPAFRGPNRDGISKETGLLKTWPKEGPPVAWTAKGLGLGFSTPTIAKGMIFGMGTRAGKDGVWALAEADGKELWFTFFDTAVVKNPNTGPSATPTFDDGKVFAVSSKGKLVGLDAKTGKLDWERDYVKEFGGKVPAWGFTDSALIDGDKLICVPGGDKAALVALNKKTGRDIWKSEIAGAGGAGGYCSPQKVTLAGAPMYVVLLGSSAGVVGVSPETGKLLWDYKGKGANGGTAQIPIPIVSGDNVWVSCSYANGGSALLKIEADGSDKFKATAVTTHQKRDLNNHHGGMVKVGDYAYFGHEQNQGNPVCVDLKTGEIKWGPEKNPGGGNGSAAVLAAEGLLYFRYQNGIMALIEASPEKLKVVSSFKEADRSGKESWAHPVIVSGKMYLRDQDKLVCYDVKAK